MDAYEEMEEYIAVEEGSGGMQPPANNNGGTVIEPKLVAVRPEPETQPETAQPLPADVITVTFRPPATAATTIATGRDELQLRNTTSTTLVLVCHAKRDRFRAL